VGGGEPGAKPNFRQRKAYRAAADKVKEKWSQAGRKPDPVQSKL